MAYFVASGNFNDDEFPDVLISPWVYFNDGSGGFIKGSTNLGNYNAGAIGDVDNDGDLDVVIRYLWLNDGAGNFTQSQWMSPWAPQHIFHQITGEKLADLNNDGFLDFVASIPYESAIHIALNDGSGNFIWADQIPFIYTETIATGDVNLDGNCDIVTSKPVNVYLGNGSGFFEDPVQSIPHTGVWEDVELGNFDEDGMLDLVLGGLATAYLNILPCFIEVNIDIKPKSYPNSINLGSNGNVPVAIFSTANFDATTIDPTTVTLAGASVRLKGKGTPMASFEDLNSDGLLDIIVHVDTTALELTGEDIEAVLKGQIYEIYSGTKIRGVDTVRIVQD